MLSENVELEAKAKFDKDTSKNLSAPNNVNSDDSASISKHEPKQNGKDKNSNDQGDSGLSMISNGSMRSNGGPKLHSHVTVSSGVKTEMDSLTPVCDISEKSPQVATAPNGNGLNNIICDLSDEHDSAGNESANNNDTSSRYLASGKRDSVRRSKSASGLSVVHSRDSIRRVSLSVAQSRSRLNTLGSISREVCEMPKIYLCGIIHAHAVPV